MVLRMIRIHVVLIVVLIVGFAVHAQDEFDQVYVNEAQTFEVLYNDSWEIVEEDELGVTFSHVELFAAVVFIDPGQFGLELDGVDNAIDAANIYREFLDGSSPAKLIENADRETARGFIDDEEGFDLYIVIQFNDGSYGIALLLGDEDGLEQGQSLVETYNNVGGNAGTAKLNLDESKNYPNELQDYAETWQEAIDELQDEGVIGIGGRLVFNENYAFFSGQGNWFTPLARNSPHTNIIMAGEVSFQAGDTTDVERCLLSSRIRTEGNTAVEFLDVGVTSNGNLTVVDVFDDDEAPNLAFRQLEVDLDDPIHILFMAIGESVTVYVNGELFIEDAEVEERSGTYGIGLIARGVGARCEGRNIWVYEVPTFEEGVCDVSSSSNVNKRSGPGTNFDRAGQLQAGSVVQVVARGSDGSFTWWKLDDDTWVREDVVTESGDCLNLLAEE